MNESVNNLKMSKTKMVTTYLITVELFLNRQVRWVESFNIDHKKINFKNVISFK